MRTYTLFYYNIIQMRIITIDKTVLIGLLKYARLLELKYKPAMDLRKLRYVTAV